MRLKWNLTGLIAFVLLGSVIYFWGPGVNGLLRTACTVALYGVVFFACFVVVTQKK